MPIFPEEEYGHPSCMHLRANIPLQIRFLSWGNQADHLCWQRIQMTNLEYPKSLFSSRDPSNAYQDPTLLGISWRIWRILAEKKIYQTSKVDTVHPCPFHNLLRASPSHWLPQKSSRMSLCLEILRKGLRHQKWCLSWKNFKFQCQAPSISKCWCKIQIKTNQCNHLIKTVSSPGTAKRMNENIDNLQTVLESRSSTWLFVAIAIRHATFVSLYRSNRSLRNAQSMCYASSFVIETQMYLYTVIVKSAWWPSARDAFEWNTQKRSHVHEKARSSFFRPSMAFSNTIWLPTCLVQPSSTRFAQ